MTHYEELLENMFYQSHRHTGSFQDSKMDKFTWKMKNTVNGYPQIEWMDMLKGSKS